MQGAAEEVDKMITWLNLPGQSHVLDLCCGTGRHSLALADAGYQVTGIDLSSVLLEEARSADTDNRIVWIESDMRQLPCVEKGILGRFDAVVNLFTSFGYFEEDREQLKVLKQIQLALKPGGRFIIDYLNPQYTIDHLVPYSERHVDGCWITETRQAQAGFITKQIAVHEEGKPSRQYTERVKLYTLAALTEMLLEADLSLEEVYGNYDECAYDEYKSPRMIIVGRRNFDRLNKGFARN